MPSKSKAQHKLMQIAAYNKEFAEKRNIDQAMAREWLEEDKKKMKEDPHFLDNLPEKAEDDDDDKKKKKKKHDVKDVSTESFLGWLFGSSKKEDMTPADINVLRSSPKELDNFEVVKGTVETGNLKHSYFKSWGNDWVNQFIRMCDDMARIFTVNGAATVQYTKAMEAVYKTCKSKQDIKEAIAYAKVHATAAKKKMSQAPAPKLNNSTLNFTAKDGGWELDVVDGDVGGQVLAPTREQIVSMLKAMAKVFDAMNKAGHDDVWTLDDTDDYRYWESKDASDDDIAELLNQFPIAGDLYEFDYVMSLEHFTMNLFSGPSTVIQKSLKKKSSVSTESNVPRVLSW